MRTILTGQNPLAPSFEPAQSEKANNSNRPIWIAPPGHSEQPAVFAYRLKFSLAEVTTTRLHVSADERYELWLDGERLGRGPERGSPAAWFYETYDLPLSAGDHVLVARVWQLGTFAPAAQESVAPGFLLVAEGSHAALLSTGQAGWEVKRLDGYSFEVPKSKAYMVVGPGQVTNGQAYSWGFETGNGEGWEPVTRRVEGVHSITGLVGPRLLRPATLPAQLSSLHQTGTVRFATAQAQWDNSQVVFVPAEANQREIVNAWQPLLDGQGSVVVPPHTRQQIVIDLDQYYCAYPRLLTSGGQGSSVTLGWAEALFVEAEALTKGQRDEVEGRYFSANMQDVFQPDGGMQRQFESLWWRAGRYIQVLVETAQEALTIENFSLEETRYPLEMESRFATDDSRLDRVIPVALRGLQMCSHETYMDCPYYEQLMYVGDTRLEVLTTYALCQDDRLPRKALSLFDISRFSGGWGLVQSRYPSREVQYIPPFALWWVSMVHDFALWRDDQAFVKKLLPGVRATVNHFLALLNDKGILGVPPGWNFEDWAADWQVGNPPEATSSPSGLLNWHLVYTLTLAQQLEEKFGEPELARFFGRSQQSLAEQVTKVFWNEERGLFADDLNHRHFSEHTQCLALLSGLVDTRLAGRIAHNLLEDPGLTRTTIYFTHYLFEVYRLLGREEAFFDRLSLWFELSAQGFKTTPEQPEPSRSDCHGWGAHPLYHYFATILGIRPESYGFNRVTISPFLGPLKEVTGSLVHPRGRIEANLTLREGQLTGSITLPDGVTGILRYSGAVQELTGGIQPVTLA